MKTFIFFTGILLITYYHANSQKINKGIVTGVITDVDSKQPIEFANIIIRSLTDTSVSYSTTADSKGYFRFENLNFGIYKVQYSFIGFEKKNTPEFTLSDKNKSINLGALVLSMTNHELNEVTITSTHSSYINSIDRKVFIVGNDLTSKTGSLSDLLQNVPSVTVDLEGNVSLRGSENVMILINGKNSALMGKNKAAVLQQLPASSIEKIEVITNPSAKYKPDGTSGIINIVLKKNRNLGLNGSVMVNAGNENRYNGNFTLNYNNGKANIYGSYGYRLDDRDRINTDYNVHGDTLVNINSKGHSRPMSQLVTTGMDYKIDDKNKFEVSGNFDYRDFVLKDSRYYQSTFQQTILKNYDRLRYDPEYEREFEGNINYTHSFSKEGHEILFDFTSSKAKEEEKNDYTNIFKIPATINQFDQAHYLNYENQSQLSLEYTNPLNETTNIEAGYLLEYSKADMGIYIANRNGDIWIKDELASNHFIGTQNNHVLYFTYSKEVGNLGILAGIRGEKTLVISEFEKSDTSFKVNTGYSRFYPSIHLSYKLSEVNELQLNYSHRIRRPEGEELNPFPENQDPLNLRKGDPYLKPEDIHSFEFGYQYKKESVTFISTLYYRYNYNGITDVVHYINDTVKMSTLTNLAKSNSAGLELILSYTLGKLGYINVNTNTYYNKIDASGLGYSNNKSDISIIANLSSGVNITKSTVMQITSVYTGKRLTPQGERRPSFVMNAGFKQEFLKKKVSALFTISDIFNSLHNNILIDTPELYQISTRKRSARIVYIGLSYNFGSNGKKQKDNTIKFDNQL